MSPPSVVWQNSGWQLVDTEPADVPSFSGVAEFKVAASRHGTPEAKHNRTYPKMEPSSITVEACYCNTTRAALNSIKHHSSRAKKRTSLHARTGTACKQLHLVSLRTCNAMLWLQGELVAKSWLLRGGCYWLVAKGWLLRVNCNMIWLPSVNKGRGWSTMPCLHCSEGRKRVEHHALSTL
jgi:hypothetical protein